MGVISGIEVGVTTSEVQVSVISVVEMGWTSGAGADQADEVSADSVEDWLGESVELGSLLADETVVGVEETEDEETSINGVETELDREFEGTSLVNDGTGEGVGVTVDTGEDTGKLDRVPRADDDCEVIIVMSKDELGIVSEVATNACVAVEVTEVKMEEIPFTLVDAEELAVELVDKTYIECSADDADKLFGILVRLEVVEGVGGDEEDAETQSP